ncbi:hypothetical protein FSBG_01133 [Fusobacterium gonidiaformans 3-1-5R]|uniref:Lipoprotein n=2 Tax=Fusobacterium TaxID=848 RepID=E5BGL3_9FUSO|nr:MULTISPECIES: hypothetical protein [Fusobacterium]EFS21636.1 hypothetical protein FSBG_01133 [Fusobacterium gonidiaformans 3-1-5R]KXA13514.1 hypothetical protein HMPREF3206_01416 [Fusobacterium equinum]
MKKMSLLLVLSAVLLTACTTSVGVGTGFNLGGLGVGLSTSAPLKKQKAKTVDEVATEALQETKVQEKAR